MRVNPPITLQDRSFNYGDGVFSTVRITGQEPELWPLHLARLEESSKRLGWTGFCANEVTTALYSAICAPKQVVKVLISRGQAGRGYSPSACQELAIYTSTAQLPDYERWQRHGVHLGLAKLQLACQPRLAGLKHNNRLEQVLIKAELEESPFDDLLVLDAHGRVTEASASNVFFYAHGRWQTPKLDQAGVSGVMREHLMHTLNAVEGYYTLADLSAAAAVFLCNALMHWVPVRQFMTTTYALEPVRAIQKGVLA